MTVMELISYIWVIKPIITSTESHYNRSVISGPAMTVESSHLLGKLVTFKNLVRDERSIIPKAVIKIVASHTSLLF